MAMTLPEIGQMVQVRGRYFIAQNVLAGGSDRPEHRVDLECIDDDAYGETMAVLWEREVRPQVFESVGWPQPENWDTVSRLGAFIHATRWSSSSVLEGLPLQAPFRGAIEIDEYQLEPVVRALRMPRVNLLIADDVGLGKTVEAGMVLQELLARQRVRRAMILCPASLQRQWQEEMQEKFALEFRIVDRDYAQLLRREYGLHVNPWSSFPRLITSVDYLKREAQLSSFVNSLQVRGRGLRDWDLLIVDEAHNMAPSGRSRYVRDSDRTRLLRQIMNHFEHRLFLTATPHNGYTESFTALLEMLDPLRFARGPEANKEQLRQIIVRRMKADITDALGNPKFPQRITEPAISVELSVQEQRVFRELDAYIRSRLESAGGGERVTVGFALTMLKKRLLSSPEAFFKSLGVHLDNLTRPSGSTAAGQPQGDLSAAHEAKVRTEEDYGDDVEKDENERVALAEASRFVRLDAEDERRLLTLFTDAEQLASGADSKAEALLAWIEAHLRAEGEWTRERLIVFTEYKDTLEYLYGLFEARGYGERVMRFYGGMSAGERSAIKDSFLADPDEHPVRILLATDAASEGLNLQTHCRYLIHYEIPWNPVRMEQRNGRIDRHGQPAKQVFCLHFAYENNEDSRFLAQAVRKVEQMRDDLGSVGDVIASSIEAAMLGGDRSLDARDDMRQKVRAELSAEVLTQERIRELRRALREARDAWEFEPDNLSQVLDEALKLSHHPGLEALGEGVYRLSRLPEAWADLKPSITNHKGQLLALVFDHHLASAKEGRIFVHLEHPLMRRALSVFRANLWSSGLHQSHQLSRVSYRVLKDHDLDAPLLLGFARLVLTGAGGAKLHEELVLLGGEIEGPQLRLESAERLKKALEHDFEYPAIPATLAARLRSFYPAHRKVLDEALPAELEQRSKAVTAKLQEKGKNEAKLVKAMIEERIREIDKRLKDASRDYGNLIPLFSPDEMNQYTEDQRWLERRKEELAASKGDEVARAASRYAVNDARLFPLALLYLLPESLVRGPG